VLHLQIMCTLDTPLALHIFNVLRLKLTELIIAMGLIDRNRDDVKDIVRFLEDIIHLFEGAVARFRVEEINYREDNSVSKKKRAISKKYWVAMPASEGRLLEINIHNSKNNICLPINTVKCHGSNHHDHEIEDPVGTKVNQSV